MIKKVISLVFISLQLLARGSELTLESADPQDLFISAAWFTKVKPQNKNRTISYCFYRSESDSQIYTYHLFSIPIAYYDKKTASWSHDSRYGPVSVHNAELPIMEDSFESSLLRAFKGIDFYLKNRAPGSVSEQMIVRELGEREECSKTTDLTIYWSQYAPKKISALVATKRKGVRMPIAYAGRTKFPGEEGWGKGWIWLNSRAQNVTWGDTDIRDAILLREAGRVAGVAMEPGGSVFSYDFSKSLDRFFLNAIRARGYIIADETYQLIFSKRGL